MDVELIVGGIVVLGVIAFVVWPMISAGRQRARAAGPVDPSTIEQRISEYRAALRSRTVCETCLHANATQARFCSECGARLASAQGAEQGAA